MKPFANLSYKQYLLFSLGAGIGLTLMGGVLYYVLGDAEGTYASNVTSRDVRLTPPGKALDKKDIWMSQMEAQAKQTSQKIDMMEKMLERTAMEREDPEREALKAEVQRLREQLQDVQMSKGGSQGGSSSGMSSSGSVPWTQDGEGRDTSWGPELPMTQKGVQKIVVNLQNKRARQRHISNILPAGAFAKAVLIGSVDANCGVTSVSDPKPVLLRILEPGKLPNNFESKLKRCMAIGSAYGDLSSERVYIRLERMSCVGRTGEVIETEVAGYVAGEDGKAGIRGDVADRSGSMVARSALGGFFGGVSQFMQGNLMSETLSKMSLQSGGNTLFNLDALKQGGSQGVGSAFDKLSEYYIKRAEQLQPVIQVAAGRTVDIVFTHGTKLGSQTTQDQVRASSSEGRHP